MICLFVLILEIIGESSASLVVTGGHFYRTSLDSVDIYTLGYGKITWSHNGNISPVAYSMAGAYAGLDGDLYIVGTNGAGMESKWQYQSAHYNVRCDSWQELPKLPSKHEILKIYQYFNGPAVFIYKETLYACGGFLYRGEKVPAIPIQMLDLRNIGQGWRIHSVTLPYQVAGTSAVVVGDRVYIIGKSQFGSTPSSDMISWKPSVEQSWIAMTSMHVARYQGGLCAATNGQDRIWVIAGCRDCWNGSYSGFVEEYKITSGNWTIKAVSKPVRLDISKNVVIHTSVCGFWNGYVYVTFWKDGKNDVVDKRFYIYDTENDKWTQSGTELQREAFKQVSIVVP